MKRRAVLVLCSVVSVHLHAATHALAQCGSGYIGLGLLLPQESVALVFSGTVASVERAGSRESVTFDIDRVWKGAVKSRMTIHRPVPETRPNETEFPIVFVRGRLYMVVAHRLSAAERATLGLADVEDAFGTSACGDGSRPFSTVVDAGEFTTIGPGGAPIDAPRPVRNPAVISPRTIKDVPPVYPAAARDARIPAIVMVQIVVDATGRVRKASVVRSVPPFDRAAIDCALQWEFLPALINGVPQPMIVIVPIRFEP